MPKNVKKVRIFSALEVANLCGVVNQTAINWIRNGYLKAFTTPGGQYRIYAEDLTAFLEKRGMRIPPELSDHFKDDVEWTTLLVVDDDAELNDLLTRYLNKHLPAFKTIQANDGFEAGRLLSEKRPGFVFLDINLPGIDGHSLCRKIKADPVFGKPFIIAMTGLDHPEEKEAILADGADAFFPKPLDFESLVKTVEELSAKVNAHNAD
jgi:two-component system, OmpR family, response regulator